MRLTSGLIMALCGLLLVSRPGEAQQLFLESVQAGSLGPHRVEVRPRFFLSGNENGTVQNVDYYVMVRGPRGNSFVSQGKLPLTAPQGEQRPTFTLDLPPQSPPGAYTLGLSLSHPRAERTELRKQTFQVGAGGDPATPTRPEPPPTRPAPEGGQAPPPSVPDRTLPAYTVGITGPKSVKVGQACTFTPALTGQAAQPVNYTWFVNGKTVQKQSITGEFDVAGQHLVRLEARDARGRVAEAELTVTAVSAGGRPPSGSPGEGQMGIRGPRSVKVGQSVTYQPGSDRQEAGVSYFWEMGEQYGAGARFTPTFSEPGYYTLILGIKSPGKPVEQVKAEISVIR